MHLPRTSNKVMQVSLLLFYSATRTDSIQQNVNAWEMLLARVLIYINTALDICLKVIMLDSTASRKNDLHYRGHLPVERLNN